jgi:hypothetical protein
VPAIVDVTGPAGRARLAQALHDLDCSAGHPYPACATTAVDDIAEAVRDAAHYLRGATGGLLTRPPRTP